MDIHRGLLSLCPTQEGVPSHHGSTTNYISIIYRYNRCRHQDA